VTHKSLEFTTQRVALDPVDHVTTVTGTKSNGTVRVNIAELLLEVIEGEDKVFVRCAAPVIPDGIAEGFAVRGRASRVYGDYDVASFGVDERVPSG